MATPAQLNACAANAQLSTGPRSAEGKAASSRNALKLGLYAQAQILPGEDPADLEQLTRDFEAEYHPQGPEETRLLHDLVRAIWLERRYTRIETEVINLRFAALSEEERKHPLGAIFIQDAEGPNLLPKIERRRAAAQRQVDRAFTDLRRLQAERRANSISLKAVPAPSVRFDKPAPTSQTPPTQHSGPRTQDSRFRTQHSAGLDNPALRL